MIVLLQFLSNVISECSTGRKASADKTADGRPRCLQSLKTIQYFRVEHIFQFSASLHNFKGDNKHGNLVWEKQTYHHRTTCMILPRDTQRKTRLVCVCSQTASFQLSPGKKWVVNYKWMECKIILFSCFENRLFLVVQLILRMIIPAKIHSNLLFRPLCCLLSLVYVQEAKRFWDFSSLNSRGQSYFRCYVKWERCLLQNTASLLSRGAIKWRKYGNCN